MKKITRKGFTLIELLAVIVLLAIIVGVAYRIIIQRLNKGKRDNFVNTYNTVIKEIGNRLIMNQEITCTDTSTEPCYKMYNLNGNSYNLTITRNQTNQKYTVTLIGRGDNSKIEMNDAQVQACIKATGATTCTGYSGTNGPKIEGQIDY